MTKIELAIAIDRIGRDFGLTDYEWEDDLAEAFSYTLDIIRNHDVRGIEATIESIEMERDYVIDEGMNAEHEYDETLELCEKTIDALRQLLEEC